MSILDLKKKLKDWEDRFLIKYKRPATRDDIKKFPKVEKVYSEIQLLKAKKLETITEVSEPISIQPSPFKPSKKGLFNSLSKKFSSNFIKRLSESDNTNTTKKLKTDKGVPLFFNNDNALKVLKNNAEVSNQEISVLEVKGVPSLSILNGITSNSNMKSLPMATDLMSENVQPIKTNPTQTHDVFGPELNKSKSIITKGNVEIDEDPVEKDQKYAIRKMLNEKSKLPLSKKWHASPFKSPFKQELKRFTESQTNSSPKKPLLKFTAHASLPEIKREIVHIPRPNKFINSNTLRRQKSFTFGDLPKNYKEFLSKDEEENFADVIFEAVGGAGFERMDGKTNGSVEPVGGAEFERLDIRSSSLVSSDGKMAETLTGSFVKETKPSIGSLSEVVKNGVTVDVVVKEKFEKVVIVQKDELKVDPRIKKGVVKAKVTKKQAKAKVSKKKQDVDFEDDEDFDKVEALPRSTRAKSTRSKPDQFKESDHSDCSTFSAFEQRHSDSEKEIEEPKKETKAKREPKVKKELKQDNPQKKKLKKRIPKTENDRGNFVSFNLKPKKGGPSVQKFGNKFSKTPKLSSYNYKKSTGVYLTAGYTETEDILLDLPTQNSAGHGNIDFFPGDFRLHEEYGGRTVNLEKALFSLTGHTTFRKGQKQVIKNILEKKSTLLVLPTAGGKSLCYQVPLFIIKSATETHSMGLIISPTISLMNDQMRCLPAHLRGAYLSSFGQSEAKTKATIKNIKDGLVDVLFVSPERIRADSFQRLASSPDFPKISSVCVDEAHCLSEWSHNFRTCYLHLNQELVRLFNIDCYLALTGTATEAAKTSICSMINIQTENIVTQGFIRNNLYITATIVPETDDKDTHLLNLLRSDPYPTHKSIIIYVMFQIQADRIAQYLRMRNFDAEAYHSGRTPEERTYVQSKFFCGDLKIIIATVAFGMGINKTDVDSVIHYCLPKSIENYIQEIGRAGRDGRKANCHLFLSTIDYQKHRSLCFTSCTEKENILELFKVIFGSQKYVGIDLVKLEKQFDLKEEVVNTVLSYVELKYPDLIQIRQKTNSTYILFLSNMNMKELQLEMGDIELSKFTVKKKGGFYLDIFKVANELDKDPKEIVDLFWDLQAMKKLRFKSETPSISLLILTPNPSDEILDEISEEMAKKLLQLEKTQVLKLDELYEILLTLSFKSLFEMEESHQEIIIDKQKNISEKIQSYFNRTEKDEIQASLQKQYFRDPELQAKQLVLQNTIDVYIKQFVRENHGDFNNGRAVARVFHGLNSPAYPAYEWYKNEVWGKFAGYDFEELMRKAVKALATIKKKMAE